MKTLLIAIGGALFAAGILIAGQAGLFKLSLPMIALGGIVLAIGLEKK